MSLAIDTDDVTDVLIAGHWYVVKDQSFDLDSYEYVWKKGVGEYGPPLLGGGSEDLIPATGFGFKDEKGVYTFGPLTSIQAVRTKPKR